MAVRRTKKKNRATPAGSAIDARYATLLARRVPLDAIVLGRAYVIHARNGGVGVAVFDKDQDCVGYSLHREKWGEHYLFTEYDWAVGEPFGTAIPLRALDVPPPKGEERLLAWLVAQEAEHKSEIEAAWWVILGGAVATGAASPHRGGAAAPPSNAPAQASTLRTTKRAKRTPRGAEVVGSAPMDEHDDAPLEALQQAIRDLHGAESTFVAAVKVREVFQGKVAWEGVVSVFDLIAHPGATRAYVWSYLTDEQRRRFVAILHVDPINTPHRAVQAYLVNEARKHAKS